MSVEIWRQKVSTSEGCKGLFESAHFKTDLAKCLTELHESSLKQMQNTKIKSLDIAAISIEFQKVILLYRTIRNLSSILSQSKWIITESKIIPEITQFLCHIFANLCDLPSLSNSSNEGNELFVLLCDIIRAALQIFCNLSFHPFEHSQNGQTIHSMLWKQCSHFIVSWIEQLLAAKWIHKHPKNDNIILHTNASRILEPICVFLHEFIVDRSESITDNELDTIMKAIYNIQLIDVHCFGNNKNYLYQKIDKNEEKTENKSKDEFGQWKHHDFIRKLMPYFINSNGLVFYMNNLDSKLIKLHYFAVSIELLFEMTESILIDVKTPNMESETSKRLNLIQYSLKNTVLKLLNVVDFSLKHIFPIMFEQMQHRSEDTIVINICQNILEVLCNVALISTSIQNKNEKIKYQNELMNNFGVIIAESMRMLQNKSEILSKYCKENEVSDDTFNQIYAGTLTRIVSFRQPFASLISTLCCDNQWNQDFMREKGVIEVLLNMTKIDLFTMFLQQWSIFAVKNLTTNNTESQTYIQNIKAQKVIQNEQMQKMGIEITYDEITGKIKSKKKKVTKNHKQ